MAYQSAHTGQEIDSAVSRVLDKTGGVTHDVGTSTTDPTGESGPTIPSHEGSYAAGDSCSYNGKEYVYDGVNWKEATTLVNSADLGVIDNKVEDLNNQLAYSRPIAQPLSWKGSSAPYTATIEIKNATESTSVDPMVWIMGTDHNRYYCDYSVTKSGTTYTITIHSNHNLSGTAYIYGIVAPR